MWKKAEKYYQTLKYLKKSQMKYLVKNRLERRKKAVTDVLSPAHGRLSLWMPRLDSHPDYLERFCLEEILEGKVTLLYEQGIPGGRNWADPEKSHLWNFNLHYLEFLIPLAAAWQEEREQRYYECFRNYCRSWIADNREGNGDGWHPYTISLRLTNLWICMDAFWEILSEDREFFTELNNSMYAQYLHLQKKLELHLLGNHYFENLKAVMLGALYFKEPGVYDAYKFHLQEETEEQILPDGVHYERSLMYHKIILEDLMRTAKAVESADRLLYADLLVVIRKMTDAMYSLEEGMGHTPLFNDAGDNVARSMVSLLAALRDEFSITPGCRNAFDASGYYCIRKRDLKLLMDVGEIAPDYMPGHGHCDGLSFELSCKGHPVFVNAGTGQYQGPLRRYFRSTAAHNTVVIDGQEQSECWGEHRVARRISEVSGSCSDTWIRGKLTTCQGRHQSRCIEIKENLVEIWDLVQGHAQAYLHLAPEYVYRVQGRKVLVQDRDGQTVCEIQSMPKDQLLVHTEGEICSYAPEFGKVEEIQVLEISWDSEGTEHGIQVRFA
ncbi:MAG: heparinase II/III family protein [Clostridiales bacterium]|nr:heparinase II/III family protein [Clostridiales bacterium]